MKQKLNQKYPHVYHRGQLIDQLLAIIQSSLNVSNYMNRFKKIYFCCDIQEEYILVVTWLIHGLCNDVKQEVILYLTMSLDKVYHEA